jgi:uncharacterized coiled-coil DUF342 family protein
MTPEREQEIRDELEARNFLVPDKALSDCLSEIDKLRAEVKELKVDSLETFHATKEDMQEFEDACQVLKKERDEALIEAKTWRLAAQDTFKMVKKLRERVAKLREALSGIPKLLHECATILRHAENTGERIRIAEHDACLIASGFVKSHINKALAQDDEMEKLG